MLVRFRPYRARRGPLRDFFDPRAAVLMSSRLLSVFGKLLLLGIGCAPSGSGKAYAVQSGQLDAILADTKD